MQIFPFTFVDEDKIDATNPKQKVKNPDIIAKITTQEELNGFLNFALDGLDRLRKKGRFTENTATKNIKTFWIRMSNSFEGFLMDCLIIDSESSIIKKDIQKAYMNYCKVLKLTPIGSKELKATMYQNGIGEDRKVAEDGYFNIWNGVRFKTEFEADYDKGVSLYNNKKEFNVIDVKGICTL